MPISVCSVSAVPDECLCRPRTMLLAAFATAWGSSRGVVACGQLASNIKAVGVFLWVETQSRSLNIAKRPKLQADTTNCRVTGGAVASMAASRLLADGIGSLVNVASRAKPQP